MDSMLSQFVFEDEIVLNIFRVLPHSQLNRKNLQNMNDNSPYLNTIKLAQSYMNNRKKLQQDGGSGDDSMDEERRWLKTEFPYFEIDECLVVTDKNLYIIELM